MRQSILFKSMFAGLALAFAAPAAIAGERYEDKRQGASEQMLRPSPGHVRQAIADWPDVSRRAAQQMIDAYGQPDGMTPQLLIWHGNGPWETTVVSSQPVDHNFPMPHKDVLAQTIYLDVPVDKFDDLARYDGSVIVERTKGTITARCDKEAANFLALNLAHDIINDRRGVEEAREHYAQAIQRWMQDDEKDPYLRRLQFEPMTAARAGDPDQRFEQVAMRDD